MRKMFIINLVMAIFMILILSVNSGTSGAAAVSGDRYVSTDGSDRNPGTEEEPWKTIGKAAESVAPGSTVFIKAGTYYERIDVRVSGAEGEPVTFRNYGSDRVIIDGSQSSQAEQEELIRIVDQSFVRLIGLEIMNNSSMDEADSVAGIGIWGKGKGIEIIDNRIHQIRAAGPSGDSDAQAITVYGRDGNAPLSGLVIDGNEIWDIQSGFGAAVVISGNVTGFEFTRNQIHDTDNDGLALIGDGTIKGEPVCAVPEKNRARNGFVGSNKMERNSRGKNPGYPGDPYGAGGINVSGGSDITIAYNTITENDIGIKVGNEADSRVSEGIDVRDNLIYGNNSSGILAGGTSLGAGWAADSRFLNNTLYQNDTKNQGRGEIHIAKSRNLMFRSNIIYTGAQNLAISTENFDKQYIDQISFNYNIYYGPGGSRGLRFTGIDTGLVGLNMWKSKTKQDGVSRIADPRFSNAGKGDFHLLPQSPAIDYGDPGYIPAEDVKDFDGSPRVNGRAVDCGAYEFVSE